MNVEIINVGTELLLGEIVNTNAAYLQKFCRDLGFNVYYTTVVGDNPQRFKDCLDTAFKRGADCVITSGGLGPTQDDLTKELSAEYLNLPMVYNEVEAKKVDAKCKFVTGWDSVPANNFKQAYFPSTAYILENEVGTANGCVMQNDNRMIINLPGPPKEMRYVIEHALKPYLLPFRQLRIYTKDYLTIGIGESRIDEVLYDLIANQEAVSIALYAGEDFVRVRLAYKGESAQMAQEAMAKSAAIIEERLSKWIVTDGDIASALANIIPPYHFEYTSDFKFDNDFVLGDKVDVNSAFKIMVDCQHVSLGDIITLNFDLNNAHDEVKIPLLKDANLSQVKLQAKVISSTYAFLKKEALISGMD